MATQHFAISVSGTSVQVRGTDVTARFVYIRNYRYIPGTLSLQNLPIYVAFGKAATVGTAGEDEIAPGEYRVYGGKLAPGDDFENITANLPNNPTETINIIAGGGAGTAAGCVITGF